MLRSLFRIADALHKIRLSCASGSLCASVSLNHSRQLSSRSDRKAFRRRSAAIDAQRSHLKFAKFRPSAAELPVYQLASKGLLEPVLTSLSQLSLSPTSPKNSNPKLSSQALLSSQFLANLVTVFGDFGHLKTASEFVQYVTNNLSEFQSLQATEELRYVWNALINTLAKNFDIVRAEKVLFFMHHQLEIMPDVESFYPLLDFYLSPPIDPRKGVTSTVSLSHSTSSSSPTQPLPSSSNSSLPSKSRLAPKHSKNTRTLSNPYPPSPCVIYVARLLTLMDSFNVAIDQAFSNKLIHGLTRMGSFGVDRAVGYIKRFYKQGIIINADLTVGIQKMARESNSQRAFSLLEVMGRTLVESENPRVAQSNFESLLANLAMRENPQKVFEVLGNLKYLGIAVPNEILFLPVLTLLRSSKNWKEDVAPVLDILSESEGVKLDTNFFNGLLRSLTHPLPCVPSSLVSTDSGLSTPPNSRNLQAVNSREGPHASSRYPYSHNLRDVVAVRGIFKLQTEIFFAQPNLETFRLILARPPCEWKSLSPIVRLEVFYRLLELPYIQPEESGQRYSLLLIVAEWCLVLGDTRRLSIILSHFKKNSEPIPKPILTRLLLWTRKHMAHLNMVKVKSDIVSTSSAENNCGVAVNAEAEGLGVDEAPNLVELRASASCGFRKPEIVRIYEPERLQDLEVAIIEQLKLS